MAQVCRALNLSDETPCRGEATHANGLFCGYHARQCMGMYMGYKKRNAQLTTLDATPPDYLAKSQTSLRNETFASVQDEKTLNSLYHYLFKKHNLLDRVIRARRLHHAHFYSQTLDYGHKHYIDRLVNDKGTTLRALQRLQRRTAEVLYEQQKWFSWVRQRQDDEENTRDNEGKKVKKEALLFKRHMKVVDARLEKKRHLEEQRKQDAYLDKAYEERLRQANHNDLEFDPIEDTIEDEREDYVDLMRRLMWLASATQDLERASESQSPMSRDKTHKVKPSEKENIDPKAAALSKSNTPGSALTRNAKKRAKAKAKADAREEEENTPTVEVNETRQEMHDRLVIGQNVDETMFDGLRLAGTMDRPAELVGKIPGMPADEVEQLLDDIAEIKELLLCRLLISQAALLPAALRAKSVDEFLADPEITTNELRDLCLRVEQPALQEIRDACADFARGDAEDSDSDDEDHTKDEQDAFDKTTSNRKASGFTGMLHQTFLPEKWSSKREELNQLGSHRQKSVDGGQHAIDFGDLDDDCQFKNKRIRLRVCGKTIWNYPSDKAMARGGWLHYSIIAKGTGFEDAIGLCRNWQEFWELNVLALFQYFPSATWGRWERDQMTRKLLQLGLIPYSEFNAADEITKRWQQRGRGRGQTQHAVSEAKNFICAHMKRNDPVSRRFVQYLSMMSNYVCILVRDGKTGRILIQPPKEHSWLVRKKSGIGRASKNEWDVIAEVGEHMFERLENVRAYGSHAFGFNSYYDITIWDLEPGQPFPYLYDTIHTALAKAHRVCTGRDFYNPVASIIKTLHRDKTSGRARDVKAGENSIYDDLHSSDFRVVSGDALKGWQTLTEQFPKDVLYNERDAAEDLVLFPEERQGQMATAIKGFDDPITLVIESQPDIKRFAYDLDTDDDLDEIEASQKRKRPAQRLLSYLNPEQAAQFEDNVPEHIPPCPDPENPDCSCEECMWYDENEVEDDEEEGEVEDRAMDVLSAVPAETEEMIRLMDLTMAKDPHDDEDLRGQFGSFLDREAANTFRQQWHEADLVPGSKERWVSTLSVLKEARKLQQPFSVPLLIELLKMELWLDYYKSAHRLVWRDMADALTLASLSFPWSAQTQQIRAGLGPEKLSLLDDLTDNAQKARGEPYSRSYNGCDARPNEFWNEAQRQLQANECRIPPAWDLVARPVIAAWLRAGMIGPAYAPDGSGYVFLVKEDGKDDPNIFINYRTLPDPPDGPLDTEFRKIDLLACASTFAAKYEGSRFALLRLWSHSHFWQLQVAGPNREHLAFSDTMGRCWHLRFIPKDMPLSDYSLQATVEERTERFQKQFAGKVVFKRDMALVMGESEEDLRWYTAAVIFALTTRPWKFEVDMWKSFVNVDLGFLEALDKKWLD
ncbi:hypothetical protein M409DRAFT_21709 [Zasmidium cellare ATCC 36951]|uniref:Uncharacterized protein n=1 Tax=Zasmidium cellare ATCC 36951 TaxID=1080233 RepID=A0A6A6CMK4_ZASCE|nr:uncharacterized protein M409DRAFT_21709 [Zasmidium cellare ATCC 36951]KAF2168271.1 hypothetical protein M409DRAFT_21709 [Zasmidium cellare ATCC 36951]